MNKGNTDMTTEMEPATFPLISIDLHGETINYLHGHTNEMDVAYNKEIITPIGEDRLLSFAIETFDMELDRVVVEVRSLNGERLIEKTEIVDYINNDGIIDANIILKDLMNPEEEYNLTIILTPKKGEEIRYYSRIIEVEPNEIIQMVDYALNFSEATFDKKKAEEEIVKHLETKTDSDNRNLGNVDIYSNFHQITWGDLEVASIGSPEVTIREIVGDLGTLELDYYVEEINGDTKNRYRVKEYYKFRVVSEDTIYLLDFERSMNQVLEFSNENFTGEHVLLGITDEEMQIVESEGGTMVAFVYENQLFAYNTEEEKAICLFSFYDIDNYDKRALNRDHNIKILNIDETENIRFMVYGIMNRGQREGEIGIQIFTYNGSVNTIEEEIFIPYHKSVELLEYEVEQLSYVSKNNILYLLIDSTIYSINLITKKVEMIATDLTEEKIEVSENHETIAWQLEEERFYSSELVLMNLNSKEQKTIQADKGERIEPLGFMGEDLIYGIAREEDIKEDQAGRIIFPMYEIRIENEKGEILGRYQEENIFVESCEIEGNQISLKRVIKDDRGNYIPTTDDHILYNQSDKESNFKLEKKTVDIYQQITQIELGNSDNSDNAVQFLTPREIMYEGNRSVELKIPDTDMENYYVYSKEGIENIYTSPAKAIAMAEALSAVVLDEDGRYLWENTNKLSKNQIMAIKSVSITEEKNSTAVCLDSIFEFVGISRNSEVLLERGETVIGILEENLVGYQVLDLAQCSLESVFYYVGKESPILVMLEEGETILIIGYNTSEVVLFDPQRSPQLGSIYKESISNAKKMFEKNGNLFISFIPEPN